MANDKKDFEKKVLTKLNECVDILKNILILQGGVAGIKKQELRKIAGVGMNQVTKITKHIKQPKTPHEKAKS